MKHVCSTGLLLLLGLAGASPKTDFTTDMTRLLRQLGGKPTPCPELEFKQVRLCATLKSEPGKLKKNLQNQKVFQPLRNWMAVESMQWRLFQYDGKAAFVVLSPLPGGVTVMEVGLGTFRP